MQFLNLTSSSKLQCILVIIIIFIVQEGCSCSRWGRDTEGKLWLSSPGLFALTPCSIAYLDTDKMLCLAN